MYTFTNTNPIHYVQHHTNTKPSTNAVKHHHLHTGSHLPTHGQNCNQTHEPLGSYSTNPRPLWSWLHTKHQPTHTGSHKTHDPPHRFTQKITTPNSPFKAEWEKEREERTREGERREKAERERVKSRAKILHHWWRWWVAPMRAWSGHGCLWGFSDIERIEKESWERKKMEREGVGGWEKKKKKTRLSLFFSETLPGFFRDYWTGSARPVSI